MPPYLDSVQAAQALRNEAVPALEELANDPDHLNRALNRFDRDDPPPYYSSTESEPEDALDNGPVASAGPREGPISHDVDAILDAPLTDHELLLIERQLRDKYYSPINRYRVEAQAEDNRVEVFRTGRKSNRATKELLKGPGGIQRAPVIARHYVKKRWQRLGVWNSDWGFPGFTSVVAGGKPVDWSWRWERDYADTDSNHPASRATKLRRGVRRGEHIPAAPRSKLTDDASASQAESFITSRPWFVFAQEKLEEEQRRMRLSTLSNKELARHRFHESSAAAVAARWRGAGDWKEEWDTVGQGDTPTPGWKWRHESPSPEPEDVTRLNGMADNDVDFTPSEVDEFESIQHPKLPGPTENNDKASQPGPLLDPTTSEVPFLFGKPPEPASPSRTAKKPTGADAVEGGRENISADTQQASSPARPQDEPPRPRRAKDRAAPEKPSEGQAAPPRRSARIAAMKAKSTPASPPAPGRARRVGTREGEASGQTPPRPGGRRQTAPAPAARPTRATPAGKRGGRAANKTAKAPAETAKPQGVAKRGRPPRARGAARAGRRADG